MTSTTATEGTSTDQFRLMAVAARLYHVQSLRQQDIADHLGVSQASVSRLLSQAQHLGIVHTIVTVPEGLHPELEEKIEEGYGVSEVHVVEVPGGDEALPHTLGWAAAQLFSAGTLLGGVTGFASGSLTLQEMAVALDSFQPRSTTRYVVQTLGHHGPPQLQRSAALATQRLAEVLGAEAVLLRAPAVSATVAHRDAAAATACVRRALGLLDRLDIAFVGVDPPRLHDPGEVAGRLDQRCVDVGGRPVDNPADELMTGVTLAQLRTARRRVVVAGGTSKHTAITAALRGGWVDTLMTDVETARFLAQRVAQDPLPPAALTTSLFMRC